MMVRATPRRCPTRLGASFGLLRARVLLLVLATGSRDPAANPGSATRGCALVGEALLR